MTPDSVLILPLIGETLSVIISDRVFDLNTIVFKFVHPLNASASIVVTLDGIITVSTVLLFLNAPAEITVNGFSLTVCGSSTVADL